ncbi:MAG: Cys-Gln thioester bond-forming surface protein, partial [Synergistaceae bacterium]|nr:Cys-Gln thioester bond-forming surface protein [Synergistaceae bacterium]
MRSNDRAGEGKETRHAPFLNTFGKTFLFIFVFILALSGAFSTPAAAGNDTVVMKYYDSIQIQYLVEHAPGTLDAVTGDIPIGGIEGVIDQLYCVDARVPFHSYADTHDMTTWPGGVTTDRVPNYRPATPLALSDSARANLNQLHWVVLNGFHGTGYNAKTKKFGTSNLDVVRPKYVELETRYGTDIDDVIALMATKVAVWHFSNPSFLLLSSSLQKDPSRTQTENENRYKLMIALYKTLVDDANKATENGRKPPYKEGEAPFFKVKLDNTSSSVHNNQAIGNYYYYGPIKATGEGEVEGGTKTVRPIFLSVGGYAAEGVSFVQDLGGTPNITQPLSEAALYGSGESRQYVDAGSSFWLKIPVSRAASSLPSDVAGGLVVHALGRTTSAVTQDTPTIVVYEDPTTGVQDWNEVQAFIGRVNERHESTFTVYGEDSLYIPATGGGYLNGDITIEAVHYGTDEQKATDYTYEITVRPASGFGFTPVTLVPGVNIDNENSTRVPGTSTEGVFKLQHGEKIHITNLPSGEYHIQQTGYTEDSSTTPNVVGGDQGSSGRVAHLSLAPRTSPSSKVTFTVTPPTYTLTTKTGGDGGDGTTEFKFVVPPGMFDVPPTISPIPDPSGIIPDVPAGTTVTLTSTPGEGSDFVGWTVTDGDGNPITVTPGTPGTGTFTMPPGSVAVTTEYSRKEKPKHKVSVGMVDGDDSSVTVSTPDGSGQEPKITSGTPPTAEIEDVPTGTTITLTANPGPDKQFKHWTIVYDDDNIPGTDPISWYPSDTTSPSTTFVMPGGDVNVQAVFQPKLVDEGTETPTYTLTALTDGNGTVWASQSSTITEGTQVTLVATPNPGYVFEGWTTTDGGDYLTPTSNPRVAILTMPYKNVTITASFSLKPATPAYTVTVKDDGGGSAWANYTSAPTGTEVAVSANPDPGYRFGYWTVEGNASLPDPTASSATFKITENVTVTAHFEKTSAPTYQVAVQVIGEGTASSNRDNVTAGTNVTLEATPGAGQKFKQWTVRRRNDSAILLTSTDANTPFVMPAY